MPKTIQEQFSDADRSRAQILDRAREAAGLTISSVLPGPTTKASDHLVKSFQSLGSRGVSNLKGKMLSALFPPANSWFRLLVSEQASRDSDEDQIENANIELARIERSINRHLDNTPYRMKMGTLLEQVIVTGSGLAYITEDYDLNLIRLDNFVMSRDNRGDVMWFISCEEVAPEMLHKDIRNVISQPRPQADMEASNKDGDGQVRLYTMVRRTADEDKPWDMVQEINKLTVNKGTFKILPWLTPRYKHVIGESYGRGLVEELLGDLRSFDGLAEAILDNAIASARTIGLLDPTGQTDYRDVTEALNGDVVYGRAQDLSFARVDKQGDMQVALAWAGFAEQRLGKAFLLESEVQPTGERVTAFQVRRVALELESALGGLFSSLSIELQQPYIARVILQMQSDGIIDAWPEGLVHVNIVTGLEAITREIQLQKELTAVQIVGQLGPQFMRYIRPEAFVRRVFDNAGVESTGLLKTPEDVVAEDNQAAQMAMQQQAAGQAIESAGAITEQAAGQAQGLP